MPGWHGQHHVPAFFNLLKIVMIRICILMTVHKSADKNRAGEGFSLTKKLPISQFQILEVLILF